jgi:hypothetical protein
MKFHSIHFEDGNHADLHVVGFYAVVACTQHSMDPPGPRLATASEQEDNKQKKRGGSSPLAIVTASSTATAQQRPAGPTLPPGAFPPSEALSYILPPPGAQHELLGAGTLAIKPTSEGQGLVCTYL